MPSISQLLIVVTAVAFPLLGAAQPRRPAAYKPNLVVGLGGAVGSYQLPAGLSTNVVSPMPTASLQLAPRFAVQVGMAYYQETFRIHNVAFSGPNGQLNYQAVDGTDRRRTVPVLVLGRYTVTKRLEKRVQADVLAGVTVVNSSLRKQGSVLDSTGRAVSVYDYVTSSTGTYFSGGAGVRYRLNPRFEGLADWVFNKLVNAQSVVPTRLSATFSLGLRYHFER